PLYTSSHGLKDDYPWSDLKAKTPRLLKYIYLKNKTLGLCGSSWCSAGTHRRQVQIEIDIPL
ncbi:hypothetical protein ACFL03_13055, partial [Thermodesulfobacteriota bacterium]